jgi:dephospho-CoA kinase
VVAPGTPGLKAVVDRFGEDVLAQMGGLDRRKLGSIVFSDPVARRDLEEIIHPAVRGAIDEWYASLGEVPAGFAVADIPLLYETARQREFEPVIVTACDTNTQLTRIMARDGISQAEARARIAAQLPMSEKIRRADYVINTDGSFDETSVQVRDVFKRLSAP